LTTLVKEEKRKQLLDMWPVTLQSINQGSREVDWVQVYYHMYVTEAMLLVDWCVAHHLIKYSNVVRDRSIENIRAIDDYALE